MSVLALAVLTAACGDDVTDPGGLLDSAEAEAVMRSAEALPLLPDFMGAAATLVGSERADRDRARATFLRARELWDAGTATDDPLGATRRRQAVRYAAPVLASSIGPPEWADARERTDAWRATAEAMLRHLPLPAVEARLKAAAHQLERADAAKDENRRVYHLLLAGSELVETTPRYVARALVREADAALAAAEGREPPLPEDARARAERLRDWARRGIEEGDYLRAIQRAVYAIQLVEGQ